MNTTPGFATPHLSIAGTQAGTIIFWTDLALIPPILFGNILVIAAYWTTKSLQLVPNVLLVNMAATDLVTGIVSIPWVCVVRYGNFGYDRHKYACLLRIIFGHIPLGVSIQTLLFMSLLRFIAVVYPLKNKVWVTADRIKILVAILWSVNIALVVGHALNNKWDDLNPVCDISLIMPKTYSYVMGTYCLGVCIVATSLYVCIGLHLRNRKRVRPTNLEMKTSKSSTRQEHRVTTMLCLVMGCFYLCWMPSFFKILIALSLYKGVAEPEWLNVWEQGALTVVFANSFMNPIIYAGINRSFRDAFMRLLRFDFHIRRFRLEECSSKTLSTESHF